MTIAEGNPWATERHTGVRVRQTEPQTVAVSGQQYPLPHLRLCASGPCDAVIKGCRDTPLFDKLTWVLLLLLPQEILALTTLIPKSFPAFKIN